MMIEELLTQQEGKTLEFKENATSLEKILRTVVAFSNTAGGRVIIGIEDKTLKIVGVDDAHKLEERISAAVSDAIAPQIVPNIEVLNWHGINILLIEIFPGSQRPYYIRSKGDQQSTYVRIGSTNRLADSFMVESLRRTRLPTTFDEGVIVQSSFSDLDFTLACDVFSSFKKLDKKNLLTLGITSQDRGEEKATYGGIILFGKEKERFLPDAWIQAGRFKGTNKVHILDSQKIAVPFIKSVEEVMGFIRKHLNVALIIKDIQHIEEWSIPQVAIRETVINAILHSDYSLAGSPIRIAIFDDRLEIENPGILPFGMTFEHLHMGVSKVRNRVIARIFQEVKFIERWGSGIGRIKEACHNYGLRPPLFEEIGYHFRVTLFREKIYDVPVTGVEEKIMTILSHKNSLSTQEIASDVSLSARQVRKYLISLIEKGKIIEIKRNLNDPEKKYFLKTKG
jgi:ATP-dependent DNA helicase RecG